MKKLLVILVTVLTLTSCESTAEPKVVTVNETQNEIIKCKRVWLNGSTYSYSLTPATQATVVDEIRLSKGFGVFIVEYRADTTWTMRIAEDVRYIKL